jgi:hypothetical protein
MNNSKALGKISTAAIAMLSSVSTASADFIFLTCGSASGYTYYMEGGQFRRADVGWTKDAFNGTLQLLMKDNGGVDLISSGGPGNNFAYSAKGCTFSRPFVLGKNELVLVATCERHVETFYFRWGDDKTGEVVSVDIAATPISNHGGVLHAPCKVGQLPDWPASEPPPSTQKRDLPAPEPPPSTQKRDLPASEPPPSTQTQVHKQVFTVARAARSARA